MWKLSANIFFAIVFSLVHYNNGQMRIDPLVETNVGLIRGLRASDGDYSMFMGIPYATVDENNPFGPSTPHPGFGADVFEAFDDSAICPQIEDLNFTIVGTLDCLHLNVYVPHSATSRNRMPVLVWIHGGGFSTGFSGRFLYGPWYLVRHDIILVTLNYRLGPYGFMCLDTPEVPGNQGLKDQQIALRWIKNNIESFGGDANKITIYGESAGGASVDIQFTYGDQTLYNKIIMHSGAALSPWSIQKPDVSAPLRLAEQLGYTTADINEALSFLSRIETNLLIAAVAALDIPFWPCVEKEFEGVERLIHDYPINIKGPSAASKSILVAYNHDESLFTYASMPADNFAKLNTFHDDLRTDFNFNSEELTEIEKLVRNFYIGDDLFSKNITNQLTKYSSDYSFNYPIVRSIQRFLDNGCKNIYYFVFSYDSERNFLKHQLNLNIEGTMHADEIGYLFDISYMSTPSPEDQLVIDRITTLWANFVKYGNPTPDASDLLPVQWPAVTEDTLNYLELSSDIIVNQRHYYDRMAFWDLFYKLNERAQYGYSIIDKD